MPTPELQPDLISIQKHHDDLMAAIEREEARIQAQYPQPAAMEAWEDDLLAAIAEANERPRGAPVDVTIATRWRLAIEALNHHGLLSSADTDRARGPVEAPPSFATMDRIRRQVHRARIQTTVERNHELAAARCVRSAANLIRDHATAGKVTPLIAETLLLDLSGHLERQSTQTTHPQHDHVRLPGARQTKMMQAISRTIGSLRVAAAYKTTDTNPPTHANDMQSREASQVSGKNRMRP